MMDTSTPTAMENTESLKMVADAAKAYAEKHIQTTLKKLMFLHLLYGKALL